MNYSKYDDEYDDNNVVCPYCKGEYQPEGEDYSEDSREEECDDCGKFYHVHQSFSVTHITTPDCDLNGGQHEWEKESNGINTFNHCLICDSYKVIK